MNGDMGQGTKGETGWASILTALDILLGASLTCEASCLTSSAKWA